MVGLNLLTLARTWKAYHTDMFEQIGFPLVFRERGGFAGVDAWHYELLLIDILIALAVAYGFAHACKEGFVAMFHKLRKLGLENKTCS
jgi:ABC-type enterochelin transport system permease subunit